jgi:hypothetical protein
MHSTGKDKHLFSLKGWESNYKHMDPVIRQEKLYSSLIKTDFKTGSNEIKKSTSN